MQPSPAVNARQIVEPRVWDAFVAGHPHGHLLQTWNWGELKARFGWRALRLALVKDQSILAGTQLLFKSIAPMLSLAYIPKGPLVDWRDKTQVSALLASVHAVCRSQHGVFLKIEPHAPDDEGIRDLIRSQGFVLSRFTVQPPRTILVNLAPPEEAILATMKPKTRYNIRLAARKGVYVRPGTADDLPVFYRLMQITGQRDGFGIHSLDYFRAMLELFAPKHLSLLLAQVNGETVACLLALKYRSTAYYLFGASSNTHRDKMPTYLLQWEAMRWAKAHGCHSYDLWGIPDEDEAQLEGQFLARDADSAGLWGVYRFKRGFGGHVVRAAGAFDYAYCRPTYWVYCQWTARRQRGMQA